MVDYEVALIQACKILFQDIRGVGYYYHYWKKLYKQARKLNLFNDKETKIQKICWIKFMNCLLYTALFRKILW